MTKLGYTWYPKDWKTNEKVFNMRLELRGFYRELIDFAYENDNNFTINRKYWCRILGISANKLDTLLAELMHEKCLNKSLGNYSIPSIERRIVKIRAGKKGGETPKQTGKQNDKQTPKQNPNQREREIKIESKNKRESLIDELFYDTDEIESICRNFTLNLNQVGRYAKEFDKINGTEHESYHKYRKHFKNWLKIQIDKIDNRTEKPRYLEPDEKDTSAVKNTYENLKKQAEEKRKQRKDKPLKKDIEKIIQK